MSYFSFHSSLAGTTQALEAQEKMEARVATMVRQAAKLEAKVKAMDDERARVERKVRARK